jgi:ankyrin repeat protein
MKNEFAELVKRYRGSPEFLLTELTDANQRGMTGDTLLHAAAVRGAVHDVEVLVNCGAAVDASGDLGNTALHYAASRGFDEIVKKLLQHGANRSITNEFGQTALDLARIKSSSISCADTRKTRIGETVSFSGSLEFFS